VTETGSTISKDCQSCHTVLGQIEGVAQHLNPQEPLGGGIAFAHPEDLGIDMMEANCSECHGPQ
jgi:mono/diheme cytochrome c family protein